MASMISPRRGGLDAARAAPAPGGRPAWWDWRAWRAWRGWRAWRRWIAAGRRVALGSGEPGADRSANHSTQRSTHRSADPGLDPTDAPASSAATPAPWPAAQAPRDWCSDTALHSETGPVRGHNEDRVGALETRVDGQRRTTLVALADGMGGHRAGDVASRVAVQAALDAFAAGEVGRPAAGEVGTPAAGEVGSPAAGERGTAGAGEPGAAPVVPTTLAARLHAALAAANAAVQDAARGAPQHAGMGTTLLLLAFGPHGAWVGWVGDSRAYRWRAGALEQLTRDDTVVMDLVDAGLLDPPQRATHPDRSVLTQAVGTQRTIPRPHVRGPIDFAADDRFLLCSDGVHDVLTPEAIAEALAAPRAHAAVEQLHALALARRSDDNLSTAVVRIAPAERRARTVSRTRSDLTPLPGLEVRSLDGDADGAAS